MKQTLINIFIFLLFTFGAIFFTFGVIFFKRNYKRINRVKQSKPQIIYDYDFGEGWYGMIIQNNHIRLYYEDMQRWTIQMFKEIPTGEIKEYFQIFYSDNENSKDYEKPIWVKGLIEDKSIVVGFENGDVLTYNDLSKSIKNLENLIYTNYQLADGTKIRFNEINICRKFIKEPITEKKPKTELEIFTEIYEFIQEYEK
jgi:hypothetical protein